MGACSSSTTKDAITECSRRNPDQVDDHCFEDALVIGSGSFGTVSVARCNLNNQPVAIKRIPKKRLFHKRNHSKLIWNERNAFIHCTSIFCCPLLYAYQTDLELVFVTPFYAGGDLKYCVKSRGPPSLTSLKFYMAELVCALESMHAVSYCHRDIKPENVLIHADGHIGLTDFGLAIRISPEPSHRSRRWGQCGTYSYRAPEVVEDLVCGFEADIYSMGVLFYYLYYGQVPWKRTRFAIEGQPLVFNTMPQRNKESYEDYCHFASLVSQMLEIFPESRISIPQIKRHMFFASIDWFAVANKQLEPPFTAHNGELNVFPIDSSRLPGRSGLSSVVITEDHQACFEGFEYNYTRPDEFVDRLPEECSTPLCALGTPESFSRRVLRSGEALTPQTNFRHLSRAGASPVSSNRSSRGGFGRGPIQIDQLAFTTTSHGGSGHQQQAHKPNTEKLLQGDRVNNFSHISGSPIGTPNSRRRYLTSPINTAKVLPITSSPRRSPRLSSRVIEVIQENPFERGNVESNNDMNGTQQDRVTASLNRLIINEQEYMTGTLSLATEHSKVSHRNSNLEGT